jgi:adenylylsulfate kinase
MYKKAKAGLIREFTGVSAPYEEPDNPEIVVDTGSLPVEDCIDRLVGFLKQHGYIKITHTDRSDS